MFNGHLNGVVNGHAAVNGHVNGHAAAVNGHPAVNGKGKAKEETSDDSTSDLSEDEQVCV